MEVVKYYCNDPICPADVLEITSPSKPAVEGGAICPKCRKPMSLEKTEENGLEPTDKTDLVCGEICRFIRRKLKDMPSIGFTFQMWHKDTPIGQFCELNKAYVAEISKVISGRIKKF